MHDNGAWVLNEFEGLDLGDARLNRRAACVAAGMLERPDKSIPRQAGTVSAAKATYRLLANERVTRRGLQLPHQHATLGRAERTEGPVLFLQDTSTLSFNQRDEVDGLGPVNTRDTPGQGFLIHNCLAVSTQGEVLGLANQQCWARPKGIVRKDVEPRTERARRENRESQVWIENLRQLGPVPGGQNWVCVADRGSDIYEYWLEAAEMGWRTLSRVFIDRKLASQMGAYLMDAIREQPSAAEFEVHERSRPGRAARTLHLSVAWTNVTVRAPRKRDDLLKQPPLGTGVVRCWDATAEVEWLLVTNWPVTTAEEAREVVAWYAMRWTIEEYHKCLKSGMAYEHSQLESFEALERLMGLHSVLATRLLQLVRAQAKSPDALATESVDEDFVKVLCLRRKLPLKTLTLHQFYRETAKMGGFLGRKGDGSPGWKTLWGGYLELCRLVEGFRLARTCG
jgi:hypothetical protein